MCWAIKKYFTYINEKDMFEFYTDVTYFDT